MDMTTFLEQADSFDPAIPEDILLDIVSGTSDQVCGGPNVVQTALHTYTLLDPLTGLGDNHH
jgi:hypothetical protein